jgi:hypothetical protein
MSDPRPAVPAGLIRDLMIEAGYRCAICKSTDPLEIEHIEEWAEVKEHKFENMIVLCRSCHGRKQNTSDPRHINRASLKRIKANLMMLNGRYSDLERRLIDAFREQVRSQSGTPLRVFIPERLNLLIRNLVLDGLVETTLYENTISVHHDDGTVLRDDTLGVTLTAKGREFIDRLETVS